MENRDIYRDIAERTDGSIYIGVVGPVRTGKSTFIKRFMERLVVPNIEGEYARDRATDELPQSGAGRTIMTTEPKFVPNEAVEITLADGANMRVRLIDCVGYMVEGARGNTEGDAPRMVRTPWFEEAVPFETAAETGTQKVINEHSTIGIVVTTDGSIGDIPRENFRPAEERVIGELDSIDKPFVILLNSTHPDFPSTQELREQLIKKYRRPVLAVNCMELEEDSIKRILENLLFEFEVREIEVDIPGWVEALPQQHPLRCSLYDSILGAACEIRKIRDINLLQEAMLHNDSVKESHVSRIELGKGVGYVDVSLDEGLFYEVLTETTGVSICDEEDLIRELTGLAQAKKEYARVASAMSDVREKGYGIVNPTIDELALEKPEIVKQGGRFGVRLRASAPSVHLIRADIQTEVSPVVGSERQSEDLVKYLLKEFEEDPEKIWQSNIFGKSLHELVNEGLQNKLEKMPEEARGKLRDTLTRIINEGSGGLICIIL